MPSSSSTRSWLFSSSNCVRLFRIRRFADVGMRRARKRGIRESGENLKKKKKKTLLHHNTHSQLIDFTVSETIILFVENRIIRFISFFRTVTAKKDDLLLIIINDDDWLSMNKQHLGPPVHILNSNANKCSRFSLLENAGYYSFYHRRRSIYPI